MDSVFLRPWPKQDKIRPSWWEPEQVLAALQGGEPVPTLCQRASDECDGAVSPRRLRADISAWCQTLSWGEPMSAAVKLWRRDTTGTGALIMSSDWHDEYLDALELANGNISDAADMACIGVGMVYARLEESSPHYDKEFADKVKLLEGERMGRLRENVLKQAESPTLDGAKLAASILPTAMPSLHGQRKRVELTADVKVEHRLAPEVVAASAARTKVLLAQRRRSALPPPTSSLSLPIADVVEAELVE